MTNEELLKDIDKTLLLLESVDLNTTNVRANNISQKNIHKAYDILFDLRRKLIK